MNRLVATVLTLCALCAAWPAAAQQQGPGPRMARPDGGAAPSRERVRPPVREATWPQRPHRAEGQEEPGGGMSPEERRQLRRDINSHGRDIYREPKGQK